MSSWSLTSYAATINWALEGYSIQANTTPQKLEGATEELPFIAASLQESAAGKPDWFGLVFDPTAGDDFWVYELYDVESDRLIKQITLNEMLGITKGNGCDLISDEQPDERTAITRYEIVTHGYDLILNRTLKRIEDPNLPAQQRLVMMFDVENRTSEKILLRFGEQHRNNDQAFVTEAGALLTVNQTGVPILIQSYRGGSKRAQVQTSKTDKKIATISKAVWEPKAIERKENHPRVEVGVISMAASTVAEAELALEQARNVATYLQAGYATPMLTVRVEVDKDEAYPGDILEYVLHCINIGTGAARDGAVVDPIPNGTEYVLGSAAGTGTVITYSIDDNKTYQTDVAGEVTHIKWSIDQPVLPGQSIQLSFRARVFAE